MAVVAEEMVEEKKSTAEFCLYYEPAYQLGLDMLKKIKNNEDVVYALLSEGLILRALDYAQEQGVQGLKLSQFMVVIERLRGDGLRGKADFVLKKIADLRKADEIRRVNSQNDDHRW